MDNSQNWAKIRSCLQDGKVCQKLGDKKETLSQFVNNHLSPIQAPKNKLTGLNKEKKQIERNARLWNRRNLKQRPGKRKSKKKL